MDALFMTHAITMQMYPGPSRILNSLVRARRHVFRKASMGPSAVAKAMHPTMMPIAL
jgi:hypothetical protein